MKLPLTFLLILLISSNQIELNEINKEKAKNLSLGSALAQCQASKLKIEIDLANIELSTRKAQLELDFRKELKCAPEDKFNWSKLTCEKPIIKKFIPN